VHIDWVEHHPHGIVPFCAPNILWSVEPPDCFATLAIPDFIRNTGMRGPGHAQFCCRLGTPPATGATMGSHRRPLAKFDVSAGHP
jgi:hypothetical protein